MTEVVGPEDLGVGGFFESVRDAVIVADGATRGIVLWNETAIEMFGFPPPASPSGMAASEEAVSEPLTSMKTEILRLLAQGQTNPQIAREFVASPGTVENRVRHIITKLGVSDRTQAAVRAMEIGLPAPG